MPKNLDKRLITILLIIFVQMLGSSMVLPILPIYAEREFDMSPRTITLLGTAFFLAQFVAGPYLGRLSDRVGRVPILIISQIGTVISFVMLALAPSIAWLYFARILDGLTGGNIIVAQAYVVDVTEPENRTQSLAYVSAAFGLGFILGPAVGGLLAAFLGVRAPYLLAALAAGITVILTWWTLEEVRERTSHKAKRLSMGEIIRNTTLVQVLIIAFFGQFSLGLIQGVFALFASNVLLADVGEQMMNLGIGLMLAGFGVSQVLTQILAVPRLIPWLREMRMVLLGDFVRAVGLLVLALATTPLTALPAIVMIAFGIGTASPALNSLAMGAVTEDVRGGVQGVYQSTLNLAIIISTALAGLMFEIRPNIPFFFGAVISVVALLPMLRLMRHSPATPAT